MDDTDKQIACAQCGFDDHEENAEYCERCGIPLYNVCVNSSCPARYDDDQDVHLSPQAAYCPFCGEKTYYANKGILIPQNGQ
ncbi:hypothetical protein GCM10025859_51630 [Alicyclobacillus fastidiosus]|nr:hypothetical protein GCM10025859_51630 [Alicyclobacillus fastidiosus]